MNATFDMTGRNVFVAGGTSGINLGIAKCFAAAGARVGVGSRDPEKVERAVAELGAGAFGCRFDVRNPDEVSEGLAGFAAEAGPIDTLVSGAAGNFVAEALKMSPNGFRAVVDIDLLGTFHVMRAAYDHLRKPGASVINISAPQAFIPMRYQSHVAAAKAGVDMLTRCLCLEWGPAGVRINGIVPGPIEDTEGMNRLAPDEKSRAAVTRGVPLQRLGKAEEIGHACVFLASDAAAYISGAVIPVDGGWAQEGARLG